MRRGRMTVLGVEDVNASSFAFIYSYPGFVEKW